MVQGSATVPSKDQDQGQEQVEACLTAWPGLTRSSMVQGSATVPSKDQDQGQEQVEA